MKRLLCMILSGLMLVPAAGCITAPQAQQPDEPAAAGTLEPLDLPSQWPEEPIGFDDPIPTDLIEIADPQPTDAPEAENPLPEVGGYDDFMRLVSASLVDGKQNRNFSPISVYLAMAMVTEGAQGETLTELLTLLGCETLEQLRGICAGMLATLSIDEKDSTLDIHNSLWMAKEINGMPVEFHDSFLKELAGTYRSEANTVEFGSQSAADQIAEWITEHTRGKIKISPDALQFDAGTLAVLINTIYLKDGWAESFDPLRTEQDTFFGLDKDTGEPVEITADYLSRFDSNAVISQGDGWLRYRVYLRNVGYVAFVLPDEGISLDHLLGSPDAIDKLLTAGIDKPCDVSLRIPKFSFQDKMELTEVLFSLGLSRCFGAGADFSAMSDVPCAIDRILQESYIGVDEYGVEAAAYTMITMRNTAFNPVEREKIEFHLTRPFLYAIESYDGTVLFIGTVTAPTEAAQN